MRILLASLVLFFPLVGADNYKPYPEEWWKPVPRDSAPDWEVLPQDAQQGEVILSKRNELGVLSNFAATPFELDGKHYASVEGFWQAMKYPEDPNDERLQDPSIEWKFTREQVAAMTAFDAKAAGSLANANMKKLGIEWVSHNGVKMWYLEPRRGAFFRVILRAELAKYAQNPDVQRILQKTGDLYLRPDHHQAADAAPAWKYHEIWMEIRQKARIVGS